MENLKPFENHLKELGEKKEAWIAKAVGKNKGALRSQLGLDKDEKVTKGLLNQEIGDLKKQDTDPDKEGTQLPPTKAKKLKRLNPAKNLLSLKEHEAETDNYMFFANVENICRMCKEILEMDRNSVDSILSDGHGWAVDHIATSKDDVEEVFNFLSTHDAPGSAEGTGVSPMGMDNN